MTTEEALKAFVETCDNPESTINKKLDAFVILTASIRNELKNDPEFCSDPLSEKIRVLIRYIKKDCAKKFAAFTRIEKHETAKHDEMLQAIQDACIALQVAVELKDNISQNEK